MKRVLALLLAVIYFQLGVNAQQKLVTVEGATPFCYENNGGDLEYKALVILENPLEKGQKVFCDGRLVDSPSDIGKDTLVLWLPLIGEGNLLEIRKGGLTLSSLFVDSPVPSDWGYFSSGTIHIIQSSHQDIAWVNTPEYCRKDRIFNTILPALEMMENNLDFSFEMEQTLNLMEFLEEFPEMKDEIIRHYKDGRFNWGATFNQPYEGLLSGEQLVRQAYFGRKWIKDNLPGCDDRTACNIDVPGRTMQMPQILSKSGIKNLFVSRMREGLYDWYSPDGSKVFCFTPGNYGWAT
ncbi:MAG: alpha-mannosidase, partial [Candidatus Cryptobacteroides sp.]